MGKARYIENKIENKSFYCAAYIRLSQDDGDGKEESNSITSQREIIEFFLKNNKDIGLYDYYIDDGFTGTDFKRPSFQRMLDDIQKKNINTIIVKDLSRFGRNYIEVGNFIEQVFPKYNIRFISISDKIDGFKNPDSLNSMIFPFKNMINEEYCRDISKKIKSSKMVRIKKGDFMSGHAPYGYIKNPDDKHRFIIDEEAANIVRLIFKMFIDGKGYHTIVNYLNDNDIYSPARYKCEVLNIKYRSAECNENNVKDKKWTMNAVRRTLINQVYCGDQIQCKEKTISHKNHKTIRNNKEEWVIVENTHDAIISREDFEKVQQILKDKKYDGAINSQPNLYASVLRCAKCGKYMVRKYTGHRRSNPSIMNYNYYCSTYSNISRNECIKNMVRSEELDKIVLKSIKHQIKLFLKVDKLIETIENQKKLSSTKISIDKIEKEIVENRKLKQKFYEDWKLNIISKEEYLKYSKSYENTINLLNERLKKYNLKLEDENKLDDNKIIFNEIRKYENLTSLNKEVIEYLIDKIYSNGDGGFEIIFKYKDEYKNLLKLAKQINKST